MRKWVGFYNYTVILTYIGFCSGVFGIFAACGMRDTLLAICCLLFSGLCDGFDGKIASTMKRTADEKKFGIQIDSLSDVVCFGVLPAAIGYSAGMDKVWCYVILIAYVLCGLIRLAYYNVTEETRQSEEDGPRKYYLGLPITASCIIFPLLFLICKVLTKYIGESTYIIYSVVLAAVAVMFIAPLKIRKLPLKGILVLVAIGVTTGVILLLL